jgi:hypothetical protein
VAEREHHALAKLPHEVSISAVMDEYDLMITNGISVTVVDILRSISHSTMVKSRFSLQ